MNTLQDKVALVTGANGGIGRAIALQLARDGAHVVVHHRRKPAEAQAVVDAIVQAGGQAVAIGAELTDAAQVVQLFERTGATFGGLDIVVHNAAIGFFKPFADITAEEFDTVIGTNVRGAFHVLQGAARTLRDGGRIATISVAGTAMPFPMAGLNNGSRAAVDQMVLSLSKELGPRGITANVVALGMVETDNLLRVVPEAFRQQVQAQTPLGRLGQPQDVAGLIGFLAAPTGAWITGQVIRATGGLV